MFNIWIIFVFFILLILQCQCDYPKSYCIRFDTDIRNERQAIIINVTQKWSPNGANHLFDLINSKFYSVPSAFFRVVPEFVVQFGISGDPIENRIWNQTIADDPVIVSNTIGTVSYATAGSNTRTTQLFINYINNTHLDPLGFSPFGIVTEGLDVANEIFNPTPGDPNGVDQGEYSTKGNSWILSNYPKINSIKKASITFNCPTKNLFL